LQTVESVPTDDFQSSVDFNFCGRREEEEKKAPRAFTSGPQASEAALEARRIASIETIEASNALVRADVNRRSVERVAVVEINSG